MDSLEPMEPADGAGASNPVQSAQRIFDILELLARGGPMGLTQIAAQLSLHKSTAHRLLRSLIAMGYARQDGEGRYKLTYKLLELSGLLLEGLDMIALARPFLRRLSEQTGEAVHLVERDGYEIVYVDKVDPAAGSIRMVSRIGLRRPMYCTAVGKAMLARMPLAEVREIWEHSDIRRLTEHTIVDFDSLCGELRRVGRDGYALDDEENELGVRCVAVCLPDLSGRADNAVSISAPAPRMDDRRTRQLAACLLEVRDALARELGRAAPKTKEDTE